MDRKKTILIAVLINAALLAVLFIAALTFQEEELPEKALGETPLLATPAPLLEIPPSPPLVQLPPAIPALELPKEEVLVHKLPPPVSEALPAVRSESPAPHVEVAVKKGDTLEKIAKAHQTTVEEIIQLNQLPSSFLRIGQVLKIPVQRALASPPKSKGTAPLAKTPSPEYYTVKVGDNPWTIAMKHHMKVEELLRLNGLNEEKARKLKPGDRLRIR